MTITLGGPTGSIETIEGQTFDGHYDFASGAFQRLQIELYDHTVGHVNEVLRWTLDRLTSAPERSTGDFSIPLPPVILHSGDYCWRSRVQSVIDGPFTGWTAKAVFSKATVVTFLDQASILPPDNVHLADLRNLRFSAEYANSGNYRAVTAHLQMRRSGAADWSLPNLLWDSHRLTRRVLGGRNRVSIEVPPDGPGPLADGTYEWRLWVVSETGEDSNIVTGHFTIP